MDSLAEISLILGLRDTSSGSKKRTRPLSRSEFVFRVTRSWSGRVPIVCRENDEEGIGICAVTIPPAPAGRLAMVTISSLPRSSDRTLWVVNVRLGVVSIVTSSGETEQKGEPRVGGCRTAAVIQVGLREQLSRWVFWLRSGTWSG